MGRHPPFFFNSSKSFIIGVVSRDKEAPSSNRDKESAAEFEHSGLYWIVKLYGISLISHFWYSASTTLSSSKKRRLLWSVRTTKCLPKIYGLHFLMAKTMAINPRSYTDLVWAMVLSF